MLCKKCGAQIDEDSVFCQKCGEKQIDLDGKNNNISVAKTDRLKKKTRNFMIGFIAVFVILSISIAIPLTVQKIQDNARINAVVGRWNEFGPTKSSYYRGSIVFYEDGEGRDYSSDVTGDSFTWSVDDDTVKLLYLSGDTIQFEIAGEFMIEKSSNDIIFRKDTH